MMGQSQSRGWCICRGAVSVEDVCLSEGLLRSVERCVLREDVSAGTRMSVEIDYLQRMVSVLDESVSKEGVHLWRRCTFWGVGVYKG